MQFAQFCSNIRKSCDPLWDSRLSYRLRLEAHFLLRGLMIHCCVHCFAAISGAAVAQTFGPIAEDFSQLDHTKWRVSEYVNLKGFIDTAWSSDNVRHQDGQIILELNGTNTSGKSFTGGEIRSRNWTHFGTYEVRMKASPDVGALSAFFVFGMRPKSEIDFVFRGGETDRMFAAIHTPAGSDGVWVDLGFDAASGPHNYLLEWAPDYIEWYADGRLVRRIETSDVGMPKDKTQIFMSLWTGSNKFTGVAKENISTFASFDDVSYTPRTAPVTVPDVFRVASGAFVVLNVLDNDVDFDSSFDVSTLSLRSDAKQGSTKISGETGVISYQPKPGFRGFDSFTYTIGDGEEESNIGRVDLSVGLPNMTVLSSSDDTFIDGVEAAETRFQVDGLEDGVDATVLVTDGTNSIAQDVEQNGFVTLDLTSLSNGRLTTMIVARDNDLTWELEGPVLHLVEPGADDDGNLRINFETTSLTNPDTDEIAVTVDGLDQDATALITVTDGDSETSEVVVSDGEIMLDLSAMKGTLLKSRIDVNDSFGNTTVQDGPDIERLLHAPD